MERLVRLWFLAAGVAGVSCFANPTPHPERTDHGQTGVLDTHGGIPDTMGPAEPDYAEACGAIDGDWDDGAGLCDVGLRFDNGPGDGDILGGSYAEVYPPGGDEGALSTDGDASEGPPPTALADVIEVTTQGEPGAYAFTVRVSSPDNGCDAYADWWEVVAVDGTLLYRRVFAGDHADQQPFSDVGEPVALDNADVPLLVRAHMNPGGYGGQAMIGSVAAGFAPALVPTGFAADLEGAEPQPEPCE